MGNRVRAIFVDPYKKVGIRLGSHINKNWRSDLKKSPALRSRLKKTLKIFNVMYAGYSG